MDRGAAAVVMVVAGGFIALQSPVNAGLGKHVGGVQAALVQFVIGTVVLLVIAAFFARGGLGRVGRVGDVSSWIYLTGGLLGAGYVTAALLSVTSLGTGGVIAATIAGELTIGIVIDQFGWFGVQQHALDLPRVAGIVLLALGVLLIVRR